MEQKEKDRRAITAPINGQLGGRPPGSIRGPQLRTRARAEAVLRHAQLTAANIVEQMARGAFFDIGRLFDENGDLRPIHQLSEDERSMIAGVEVVMKNAAAGDGVVDRVLKIKIEPRSKYVELAAKVRGMITDQVDVRVIDAGSRLDAARQRARERNARVIEGTVVSRGLPEAK